MFLLEKMLGSEMTMNNLEVLSFAFPALQKLPVQAADGKHPCEVSLRNHTCKKIITVITKILHLKPTEMPNIIEVHKLAHLKNRKEENPVR